MQIETAVYFSVSVKHVFIYVRPFTFPVILGILCGLRIYSGKTSSGGFRGGGMREGIMVNLPVLGIGKNVSKAN